MLALSMRDPGKTTLAINIDKFPSSQLRVAGGNLRSSQ
jgi:hypothetical protein